MKISKPKDEGVIRMIQAAADYIAVDPVYEPKIGLIYLPDSAKKEEANAYGVVVSIGPDFPFKEIKLGDKIIFRRHEGREAESDGKRYLILDKKWVSGVIE